MVLTMTLRKGLRGKKLKHLVQVGMGLVAKRSLLLHDRIWSLDSQCPGVPEGPALSRTNWTWGGLGSGFRTSGSV